MTDNGTDDVEYASVKIALPLPSDIVTTLVKIVGVAYPGTMIDTSGGERPPWEREMLHLKIPENERYRSKTARKKLLKAKQHNESEHQATITAFRDGLAAETPEHVSETLGVIAAQMFANMAAENYIELEMAVRDPASHNRFVVIVAKSKGQTPHALRKAADAEVERLRARVAELEGDQ